MQSSMFITTSRLEDDTSAYGYKGIDYGFHTEVRKNQKKKNFNYFQMCSRNDIS